MACDVQRASWRHGVSCGEWRVSYHGGVWSAGRVASGLTGRVSPRQPGSVACGVWRHGVLCGEWRVACGVWIITACHGGVWRVTWIIDSNVLELERVTSPSHGTVWRVTVVWRVARHE